MLRVKAGVESATDGDGAAVLDADTGVISTLNSTGAYVWNKLCSGTPLQEIVRGLAIETGEQAASVEPDVQKFVEQLRAEGLVRD